MFHSRNGLFFHATGHGDVRIIKTHDGKNPYTRSVGDGEMETNIVCDVTLHKNEWASVVCSVSAGGETIDRWNDAREFHMRENLVIPVGRRGEVAAVVSKFGGRMASSYTDNNPCEFYIPDDGGKHRVALTEALREIGADANYCGFTDVDYVYRPILIIRAAIDAAKGGDK